MNKKRLLKLADFLDTLPRQKFDFTVVARVPEGAKPMAEALKAGRTQCGTVGCAIGWMPAVFPRGLTWREKWSDGSLRESPHVVLRRNAYAQDFEAAAEWFGISDRDASLLFTPEDGAFGEVDSGLPGDATPKHVARHIRRFVKNPEKAIATALSRIAK